MKLNLVFVALLFAISTSSQDKPKELSKPSDIATGLTILSPSTGGVAMTCSGMNMGDLYDSTEVYDCKLENGHTLDGVVRVFMKIQREQYERCEAEKKVIFDAWGHSLKRWEESIPKPIPHDSRGKS